MKKRITLSLLILLIILMPAAAQLMLEPVAAVNLIRSEMISRNALDAKIAELEAANGGQKLNEEDVLDIMINDVLVLQGAERGGIVLSDTDLATLVKNQKSSVESQLSRTLTNEEFDAILQQAYQMSLKEFTQTLYENYIVNSYIRSAKSDMITTIPAPTADQIKAFYRKNTASFINPEYSKFSHIFITKSLSTNADPKAKADEIHRKVRYGTSTFDELVVSASQDEKTKFLGGTVGWVAIDDAAEIQAYGESFINALFALEVNEISQVLESKTGYHIVKILDHRDPRILGLDDTLNPTSVMTVRQYINQNLYTANQEAVYQKAISELVAELRAEAQITILL